jgi:glyoxylase-like metal-dependent hydrolase (beta-lactamase superfamily II)
MPAISAGLDYIDLQFLGRPHVIATAILHGAPGVALIDPGPTTTIGTLESALGAKGIRFRDVRHLLLTHIHLDHAGAAGTIVSRHPHIAVVVHRKGAPHLIDPAKLLSSAGRQYGQDMDRLWGEVLPVPAESLQILDGGEALHVAGRDLRVEYTPGHASHHVSFFDEASHVAFVGDTAGIRRRSGTERAQESMSSRGEYVMPAAPPPDIDIEAWAGSRDRILKWNPAALFLTHFGHYGDPRQHFDALFAHLSEWSRIVRHLLADGALDDGARQERFVEDALRDLRRAVGETAAEDYVRAGGLVYSWMGLSRYWRKRESRP